MIYFHYWINKLSSERSTVHRMPKEVRKVAGSKYQQSKTVWNRLVLWGQFVLFGLFSHEKFLLKVCLKNYIVHLWLTAIDDRSKWSGTFYIYMVSIDVRIVIGCGDVMGWWWNKFICRPIGKFRSHMLLVLLWLLFVLYIIQKTNICCRQTGSQVRSQRALWVNRWSTSQITAWRGRAWSSTRSRLNPPCTTSNMTMTSTSTSTIWWRPPSTDCPVSSSAHGSSLTRPVLQPLKCYRCQISSSRGGGRCAEEQKPCFCFLLTSWGFSQSHFTRHVGLDS